MIKAKRVDATIPTADLARAVRWYRDKLGLEPVSQDEKMGAVFRLSDGTGFCSILQLKTRVRPRIHRGPQRRRRGCSAQKAWRRI